MGQKKRQERVGHYDPCTLLEDPQQGVVDDGLGQARKSSAQRQRIPVDIKNNFLSNLNKSGSRSSKLSVAEPGRKGPLYLGPTPPTPIEGV